MSLNRMAGERYFLGVDGGATKTLAVVVDARGHESGRGVAGSGNHESVGFERAVQHVREAVEAAIRATGATLPLEAAWIGLAGIDRPEDQSLFLPQLESLACQVQLTNDAELTLAALPRWTGIALIAGTGSIAIGRGPTGTMARTGGWGHMLGDEGSGYDLGRQALQALQAALRAADGRGEHTQLLALITAHWKLARIEDGLPYLYQRFDKAEIARLSDLVFAADQAGDPVARAILSRGASELAWHVLVLNDVLGFAPSVPLALGGGLFVHQRVYRQRVLRRLRARIRVGPIAVVVDPALSAARAARGLMMTARS